MKDLQQDSRLASGKRKGSVHWVALIRGLTPPARLCAFLLVFTLVPTTPVVAQPANDEPPIAGRPEDFSELVGFYEVSSKVEPREVCVEDPVVLTVRISGSGPRPYQPERRTLRLFPPKLKDDFYVEPLPDRDRVLTEEKAWEFVYRLRPKRLDANKIQSLKLVYYSPARKRFQSTYSDAIALAVKPRPVAQAPPDAVKGVQPPERIYELVTGAAVLQRAGRAVLPGHVFLCLVLVPPVFCALWYIRWRRAQPDHGRLLRQRHSRAGQLALHALRQEPPPGADQVFAVMTAYLRSRFDFAAAEPTPADARGSLARVGVSKATRQKVSALIESCDAARFAPSLQPEADGLATEAAHVVQALEGEAYTSGVSKPRSQIRRRRARITLSNVVATLLLLVFGQVGAQEQPNKTSMPESELLAHAEAAFLEGKNNADKPAEARQAFARSADLCEELRRRGITNPELCRNLGNAALLAGRLARAVFAYREGQRQAPNDGVLQANLEYARSRVHYPPGLRPTEYFWPTWLPRPDMLFLQCSTLVLCALACPFWVRRFTAGRGTGPAFLLTSATVLAGAGLALLDWHALQEERYPLVVIAADDTPLQRGNGTNYPRHPTLLTVNEGMEARRLVERGDWLQIQFPGGQVGWVPRNAVVISGERGA
jgi:hypothetical protein